jgi:hydrogenase expression/formation protein HypE
VPTSPLPPGKLPSDLLAAVLGRFGPPPPGVTLGPSIGEDACAIEVPPGLLVAATDPITLTGADVGRLAVIVNANDVAVTGARPRWFLATVLLPPGTTEADVVELFEALGAGLRQTGAVLVGGHTEVSRAVTQPVVVGQMLGVVEHGRLIRTGGAEPGDVVVQIGPVPVEGAAVLAAEADGLVDAALAAAGLGATALHDPTEGGLAAGLHELALASGVSIRVDVDAVQWFAPGVAVCGALGADPWATLASGAVLATFADPSAAAELGRLGHAASVIGTVEPGSGVTDRSGRPIPWPERDEVARVLERRSS